MKSNTKLLALFGLITMSLFSCEPAEKHEAVEEAETIDMAALTVEIQAMEDAFSAAEKAKDANAVVAYYSDNIINYGSNSEPVVGKESLRAKIAERLANDTTGNYNVYKVVDLFAEGNSAVEIGSWTSFDAAGNELENGHYMSYFQKEDGQYKCVRDMSSSTKPLDEEDGAEDED